jgi:hypothetical protein
MPLAIQPILSVVSLVFLLVHFSLAQDEYRC